jgi:membrane dipeptidase
MQQALNIFIDAHEDIAYNALEWGRDIRDAASVVRAREALEHPDYRNPDAAGGITMSGLPDLRRGGYGIVFSTLFAFPWCDSCDSSKNVGTHTQTQIYSSADEAYHVAQQQLAYYRKLVQEPGLSLIQAGGDLSSFLGAWRQASPTDEQRLAGAGVFQRACIGESQ